MASNDAAPPRPTPGIPGVEHSDAPSPRIFKHLLDALSNPILVIDEKRMVLIANAPAKALLGAGIEGRDLISCLRHPEALAAVRRTIEGQPPKGPVEIDWPVPVVRSFSLHLSTLEADGAARTICLEFKEQTLIKGAQAARRDFIVNISHELRTPLSALMGFIDTLQGPASADVPAQRRFLDIMGREARRMNTVIDELIALSHVESEEHVPPIALVDISSVVRQAVDIAGNRAEEMGLSIDLRLEAALPPVRAEREQILQMMTHLIANAIQYGRDGEIVRISVQWTKKPPHDGVLIEVRDFGQGIAPEHLPRLTERFYRADIGRTRSIGGAGLGLAIVKHVVNRHRGRLVVNSAPGAGSVFSVFLPAADDRPAEKPAGHPPFR